MKKIVKKIGYTFLFGAVFFVLLGVLISFAKFAVEIPLSLLGHISPIKNIFFLIFITILSVFSAGLLVDWLFKKTSRLGNKRFLNYQPALTNSDALIIVTGEEILKPNGRVYVKAFWPIVHPITGLLFCIPKDEIRFLKINPAEIIKLIMSDGAAPLENFEFIEQRESKSQITD